MDIFQILTIVNCVMSSITATVVCVALLPHVKDGMVIIRDAVLWLALIALLSAVGWLGFEHLRNSRSIQSQPTTGANVSQPVDEYYAGR